MIKRHFAMSEIKRLLLRYKIWKHLPHHNVITYAKCNDANITSNFHKLYMNKHPLFGLFKIKQKLNWPNLSQSCLTDVVFSGILYRILNGICCSLYHNKFLCSAIDRSSPIRLYLTLVNLFNWTCYGYYTDW